ncbi:Protein SERAC1-like protein [Cladobotryum mycophilum]|uniref:Protein SERAC1-like protein n=1 Tax=Cladobotryum mycophilum TaxID=491253 RepID=A0ABR0SR54_9HYPO
MSEDSCYGVTVLYQPSDPEEAVFDLVAIHGLKGHAIKTWTHKQSQVMWLRDLLPKGLPNARIMTYGYNSRFVNFTGHQELRNIAMKLLSELVDLRKSERELARPLIFVCHSLGGIVAKKALLIGCSSEEAKVQAATYGIIFMATPHCGSSLASLGKILSDITATCTPIATPRRLLGPLKKDSKDLLEITADFVSKVPKLHLVSFYEMEMTSIGIFKRFVVEKHSAILNVPDEVIIGQYADHRSIARFSSVDDRSYRPVLSRLVQMGKEIKNTALVKVQVAYGTQPSQENTIQTTNDDDAPFLVPFAQCIAFHGRESLIADMEKYFWNSRSGQQLIFAISGLGGCGKTQTALRYAFQNRFRYKSGVLFFNATSNSTLMADFHRFHEFLNLGSVSNKIDSLKQWFSSQRNRDWLMIFDNADDLPAVPLEKYFPIATWGHIIVTGRDQSMVGQLATAGELLEPLDEENAVSVLFSKAAINPSSNDVKEAKIIVGLLGCLPLAIDQAGAYIRRRAKSLSDYRHLLESQMYKVLEATPGMQDHEKSVISVWELNFRQVEQDSPAAWQLLLLLAHLEPEDIPELLLTRGSSPKRIWNSDGEPTELSAEEAGVDGQLVALLQDEMKLDEALEHLTAFSLVQRNTSGGRRAFSIHTLVQHCVIHRVNPDQRQKWQTQAILLVAQAFPFNVYLDNDFGNTGREFLPNVSRIVKEFDSVDPKCPQYDKLKQAMKWLLLSSSRFRDNAWKREAIRRVNDLLKDDSNGYLNAWAASRESTLLRMNDHVTASHSALEEHINRIVLPGSDETSDARYNATKGDLVLSFAENLIKDNELSRAKTELEAWRPLSTESPSTMEKIVVQSRSVTLGRILKSQGHFHEALPWFEKLFHELTDEEHFVSTGWQMVMFSNLADLYCEVGRPTAAESALQAELKVIYARGWENISTGRRLQLALIETFIRRGMFEMAETCLVKLLPQFEAITEPNVVTATGYFRTWVGLARISHLQSRWDEAFLRWNEALGIIKKSKWPKGFNHGLVLYSLAQVLFQTGDMEGSHAALERAKVSLQFEERKYWIVGLGSYWYDYVVTELGQTGPNPIVDDSTDGVSDSRTNLADQLFNLGFGEGE